MRRAAEKAARRHAAPLSRQADAAPDALEPLIGELNEEKGRLLEALQELKAQVADRERTLGELRGQLEGSRTAIARLLYDIVAQGKAERSILTQVKQQKLRLFEELGDAIAYATPAEALLGGNGRESRGFWGLLSSERRISLRKASLTDLVTWGDHANARRDWSAASAFYAVALQRDPSLLATWIQYGHALKEHGHSGLAESAYRRAVSLEPASTDALVQLGHYLKRLGQLQEARELFERAIAVDAGLESLKAEVDFDRRSPMLPISYEGISATVARIFEDCARLAPDGEWPCAAKVPYELSVNQILAQANSTPRPASEDSWPAASLEDFWPPAPLKGYWLPQSLRDYFVERVGEGYIPLYQYLMSVIASYGSDSAKFAASNDLQPLLERARYLSRRLGTDTPEASVIIPVFNNVAYTLTSVVSLLETAGDVKFEVIVGDDQSTDSTSAVIGSIGGAVRLVRHSENLGFLFNCNQTAKTAGGKFLLVLNNDTLVFPGWLDELVCPLKVDTRIGMTGSKLLNSDGTLQEAGGIYWRDGTAWNFGRNQDPRMPEFNYAKEADYVSGASLAIPTDLWQELGGFDSHYAPAYCEDADLAFRVRATGRLVHYVPQSELIHHEGASHGRDEKSGIKSYQVTNMQKLRERWKDVLEADHFENGTHVVEARDRSRRKPHVVVIDHYVPEWDRDAGSRSMLLYVKLFVEAGFQVAFWPDNLHETPYYTRELQKMGVEVIYSAAYHGRFADWFDARAEVVDYAFVSRPHVAERYLEDLSRYPKLKILYYGHDLHFMRAQQESRFASTDISEADIERMRRLEVDVCRRCDVVFFPNSEEVTYMRSQVSESTKVDWISVFMFGANRFEAAERRLAAWPSELPKELLFVGGFGHSPNRDGVVWFLKAVMPLLRAAGSQVRFHIVGSNTPEEIRAFAGDDVIVHGQVSDEELAQLYAVVGVAVAPLRYGGGVKGKVLESMANGIPLVMTSVGAQGIDGADRLAYVEDAPAGFAAAIERVLSDAKGARRRTRRALAFAQEHHSVQAVRDRLARHMPEFNIDAPSVDETRP